MPKIGKRYIRLNHDNVSVLGYAIDVNYSTEYLFYAQIPQQFDEVFDTLKKDELLPFRGHKKHKWKHGQGPYTRIVKADSEDLLEKQMKAFIIFLLEKDIKKRDVILVYCDNDLDPSSPQDLWPRIKLGFGIKYCEEISSGKNDPVYQRKFKREWFGKEEEVIEKMDVGSYKYRDCTIIDDTPENREALEGIYKAFKKLIEKLSDYTSTPEKILSLINSKQKLLR
jgi:hypothetical protein